MSENTLDKEGLTEGYHWAMNQEVAFAILKDMKYNPMCFCDNTGCPRHGNCRACLMFHKLTDHPPTCKYKWKREDFSSCLP